MAATSAQAGVVVTPMAHRPSRWRFRLTVAAEAAVVLVGMLAILLACSIVLPGGGG